MIFEHCDKSFILFYKKFAMNTLRYSCCFLLNNKILKYFRYKITEVKLQHFIFIQIKKKLKEQAVVSFFYKSRIE